jgi:hypothetical protein
MKFIRRPIFTTIGYGLACGLALVPGCLTLTAVVSWSSAICLLLWLFVSGYALFLSRWSAQPASAMVLPVATLFFAVFIVDSAVSLFLLAQAVISWIRSGVCFLEHRKAEMAFEIVIWIAGGALISAFPPASAAGWALGIWMFFLLQSLYFVFFEDEIGGPGRLEEFAQDPFERASRQAAAILDEGLSR